MWSSSNRGIVALIVLATLLLGGCGFHLRGAAEVPPQLARTQLLGTSARGPLAEEIAFVLDNAGAQLVQGDATSLLRITEDRFERRLLSVGSTGRATEYEITYRLGFTLSVPFMLEQDAQMPQSTDEQAQRKDRTPLYKVMVPGQTIVLQRDYSFDPSRVLGKAEEEEMLMRELRAQAVRQMLLRLQAGLRVKDMP